MFKKKVKVSKSPIGGRGVFADESISRDDIVWVYESGHDLSITQEEFSKRSTKERQKVEKIGYLSPWSKLWIFPPMNDPAQFTNHSSDHNLSAVFDREISPEPYFVANKDISKGEELTNNYNEFDVLTRGTKPDWAK